MYAALSALVNRGVAVVERFATTKTQLTQNEILAACGNKSPAIILMQDRAVVHDSVTTMALGTAEKFNAVEWTVLLCVSDTRDTAKALKGPAPQSSIKGIYKLQSAVYAALNGLEIPGMWHDSNVEAISQVWGIAEPGKLYVSVMRFVTDIVLEPVPPSEIDHVFATLAMELNLPERSNDTVSTQTLVDSATVDMTDT